MINFYEDFAHPNTCVYVCFGCSVNCVYKVDFPFSFRFFFLGGGGHHKGVMTGTPRCVCVCVCVCVFVCVCVCVCVHVCVFLCSFNHFWNAYIHIYSMWLDLHVRDESGEGCPGRCWGLSV